MAEKTITLTGTETAVTGLDGSHAAIRNDGTDVIYAAKQPGITPGADGVMSVPAGSSAVLRGISGIVYLTGTGSAMISTSDYGDNPFKSAAQGGSGADDQARAAINAHAGNANIHVTADDKANWNGKATILEAAQAFSNPNLLINPDFKVNQYGFTSMVIKGTTHFIDRWYAARAAVAIADNGITLAWNGVDATNGWIQQQIENDSLFGKAAAVSGEIDGTRYCAITEIPVSANTSNNIQITDKISFVVGNVNNKTISFSVISNSTTPAEIGKFKIELGSITTPFVPPDPATELTKCQRYYYEINGTKFVAPSSAAVSVNTVNTYLQLPTTMRIAPSLSHENICLALESNGAVITSDITLALARFNGNICKIVIVSKQNDLAIGSSYFLTNKADTIGRIMFNAEV